MITSLVESLDRLIDEVNLLPDDPTVDDAVRHLIIARALLRGFEVKP
jgi:hypothetical protein